MSWALGCLFLRGDELGSVVPQVERRVLILCQYFVALVSTAVSVSLDQCDR